MPSARRAVRRAARRLRFYPAADGRRLDTVAFHILVFDDAGTLLNSVEKAIRFDLPRRLQKLMSAGVGMRLDISLPTTGDPGYVLSWIDVPSSRFDAVELSSDRIEHTPAAESKP